MILRWILGGVLAAAYLLIAATNWSILLPRRGTRAEGETPSASSMVPLVGGIMGAAAVGLLPPLGIPWWLPALLDPGCALYVVLLAVLYGRERLWRGRQSGSS